MLLLFVSSEPDPLQWLKFDNDAVQRPPSGFTLAVSGMGEPAGWFVVRDESAPSQPNALAQPETDRAEVRYPLCVFDSIKAKNLGCGVSLKIIRGLQDQSAGIVWRYIDRDNYYLACVGTLDSRISVCKMVRGRLTVLQTIAARPSSPPFIKPGKWFSIQVINVDRQIQLYINMGRYFEFTDDTFLDAGKVGLWTRSGSYVHFDDLYIQVGR